jgi:hypothetical protein
LNPVYVLYLLDVNGNRRVVVQPLAEASVCHLSEYCELFVHYRTRNRKSRSLFARVGRLKASAASETWRVDIVLPPAASPRHNMDIGPNHWFINLTAACSCGNALHVVSKLMQTDFPDRMSSCVHSCHGETASSVHSSYQFDNEDLCGEVFVRPLGSVAKLKPAA